MEFELKITLLDTTVQHLTIHGSREHPGKVAAAVSLAIGKATLGSQIHRDNDHDNVNTD